MRPLLLLLGLLTTDLADAQRNRHERVIRGARGEVLSRNGDFVAAVGGSNSTMGGSSGSASAVLPRGVFEITLQNTGTGWEERFLIGVPRNPLVPAPLLTVFHGYGEEPEDLAYSTSYFQEAMARGWYVLAPLGAHKFNFAIDYAQTNVEAAFDWAATYLHLDPDRLYSVGFSMGGGMSAAFAARHLDPLGPRFAAVAVHTGTCSMRQTYWEANDKSMMEHSLMFGGSPSEVPFRYQIASSIDLISGVVDQESDLLRNLQHVPLYHFAAASDPNAYLVDATEKNHQQAQARGTSSQYESSNDSVHRWWTLDEKKVLDWLEPKTLVQPADGDVTRVLADRTGRWYDIHVEQTVPELFTPFRWTVLASFNRVVVDEVENATSISLDPVDLGLNRALKLEFVFNNVDGAAVDLVLEGYASAPTLVLRAGDSTANWSYDPEAQTVTLFEAKAAGYPMWEIFP